jgi:crotonobetainyl-CoA:carnitine CoA-transferase CaiB-like acyl-CoA transferase
MGIMEKVDVPCGPINSIDQVVADPQVRSRGMITSIDHPGAGAVRLPSSPVRLSRTPSRVDRPAPRLGEHTADVLKAWLGLEAETITALTGQGVIA